MQYNGVQVPPEYTVVIKGVQKKALKLMEKAISQCGAKTANPVLDKDPLYQNEYLIFANYTSARAAKQGQNDLVRWLDDNWHSGKRPGCTLNSRSTRRNMP